MPVTGQTLNLQSRLEADLTKVTDQQVRDLTQSWVRSWDETAGDLDAAIQLLLHDAQTGIVAKVLVTRNRKLLAALDLIGRRLGMLAAEAGVRLVGDVRHVVATAAAAQAPIIGSQLPTDLDLTGTVHAATIEAIVSRTAQQITAQTYPLGADAYDAMRRELLRGVVVGTNPRHTGDRIMRRSEMRFNGGLARALTIARTETLDAHRAGAGAGQAAHADVLTGWVWTTHLSPRTCPACLSMNGREFPLSVPGPQGHQQCRCARVPKTKSWAELGLPDMDEPVDLTPTRESTQGWFNGLSPTEQLSIMGPERLHLLTSGQIGWDDLATLTSTPGWRDSWQITPVRDLQRRAAA
jgi:hypothetical protein